LPVAPNFSKGYHQSFSGFRKFSKNRVFKSVTKRLVFPIEVASEFFPGGWPTARQAAELISVGRRFA
jgi:hypothetical protein